MGILIVEDDAAIADSIVHQLRGAGFSCDCVTSIADALKALGEFKYDLMLLDRRLPDGDGAAAIPKIRVLQPCLRVMILTAYDAIADKISGLNAGADDYLTKPFNRDELMARVRARLREYDSAAVPPLTIGALTYHHSTQEMKIAGQPLVLHRRELNLLETLLRHVNQVAPRKMIMHEVYGFDEAVVPGALDTLVWRLRKRLDDANAGVAIHAIRGRGYLLTKVKS